MVNEAVLREDVKTDECDYSLISHLTQITRDQNSKATMIGSTAWRAAWRTSCARWAWTKSRRQAQKQAEQEELIDAFVEALEDGASLWRGRRLRIDDLHDMPEEWDSLWEYSSER